jgi:hypothetical protein
VLSRRARTRMAERRLAAPLRRAGALVALLIG